MIKYPINEYEVCGHHALVGIGETDKEYPDTKRVLCELCFQFVSMFPEHNHKWGKNDYNDFKLIRCRRCGKVKSVEHEENE